MTLESIFSFVVSFISTLALIYFAYGTYRIDSKLGRVEKHLAEQNEILRKQ